MKDTMARDFLEMAVPLEMQRLAGEDPTELALQASEIATVISTTGDVIAFYAASATAPASAQLVRGLAILALVADGGVAFDGLHWCKTPPCLMCDAVGVQSTPRRELA